MQDALGARIAAAEGADRIELCAALGATGGLTPSFGAIRMCAEAGVPRGVHVLIRNRGGDFIFDADDQAQQLADVRPALEAGASGIVVGGLRADGGIDADFARRLADTARDEAQRLGLPHVDVTFHRAFDMVPAARRRDSLETLIALGYTRILTSGGAPTVPEGLEALAELAAWADGRIEIMAGGGLKAAGFARAAASGVDALHLSAKTVVRSAGGPGGGGSDGAYERTDAAQVREAVRVVRGL